MRFLIKFLLVIDLRFILFRTVASSLEIFLSLFSKSSPLTLNIPFQIRDNNPLRFVFFFSPEAAAEGTTAESFFSLPLSTTVPSCSFSPTAISDSLRRLNTTSLKIKLQNLWLMNLESFSQESIVYLVNSLDLRRIRWRRRDFFEYREEEAKSVMMLRSLPKFSSPSRELPK